MRGCSRMRGSVVAGTKARRLRVPDLVQRFITASPAHKKDDQPTQPSRRPHVRRSQVAGPHGRPRPQAVCTRIRRTVCPVPLGTSVDGSRLAPGAPSPPTPCHHPPSRLVSSLSDRQMHRTNSRVLKPSPAQPPVKPFPQVPSALHIASRLI